MSPNATRHRNGLCARRLRRGLWLACAVLPTLATAAPGERPAACLAWGTEAKIDTSENSFCGAPRALLQAATQGAGQRWAAAAGVPPSIIKTDRLPELEVINPVLEPAAERPVPAAGRAERVFNVDQASGLRARWWLSTGVVGVGAGADWAVATSAAASTDATVLRPVIGVRAELSQNTRLIYELRAAATPLDRAAPAAATPEGRFALEFKATGGAARSLPVGFLRIQISGSSTINLRPRRGGFAVAWRSHF